MSERKRRDRAPHRPVRTPPPATSYYDGFRKLASIRVFATTLDSSRIVPVLPNELISEERIIVAVVPRSEPRFVLCASLRRSQILKELHGDVTVATDQSMAYRGLRIVQEYERFIRSKQTYDRVSRSQALVRSSDCPVMCIDVGRRRHVLPLTLSHGLAGGEWEIQAEEETLRLRIETDAAEAFFVTLPPAGTGESPATFGSIEGPGIRTLGSIAVTLLNRHAAVVARIGKGRELAQATLSWPDPAWRQSGTGRDEQLRVTVDADLTNIDGQRTRVLEAAAALLVETAPGAAEPNPDLVKVLVAQICSSSRGDDLRSFLTAQGWTMQRLQGVMPVEQLELLAAATVAEELIVGRPISDAHGYEDKNQDLFAAALTILLFRAHEISRSNADVVAAQVKASYLLQSWLRGPGEWRLSGEDLQTPVPPTSKAMAHVQTKRLAGLVRTAPWILWRVGSWPVRVETSLAGIIGSLRAMSYRKRVLKVGYSHGLRALPASRLATLRLGVTSDGNDVSAQDLDKFERVVQCIGQGALLRARSEAAEIEMDSVRNLAISICPEPRVDHGRTADLHVVIDPKPGEWRLIAVNADGCAPATFGSEATDDALVLDSWQDIRTSAAQSELRRDFSSRVMQAKDMAGALPVLINGRILTLPVGPRATKLPPDTDGKSIDPEMFVGRGRSLATLSAIVFPENPGDRRPALIRGNRRAGKTTLARQVFRQNGHALAAWDMIDVSQAKTTATFEGFVPALAEYLKERLSYALVLQANVELPKAVLDQVDPVRLLDALDMYLRHRGDVTVGLLLDEFDAMTYTQDPDVVNMVTRLTNSRWDHIALIATVQRHAREYKEWHLESCPALVSSFDAVQYFSPHLVSGHPGTSANQLWAADRICVDQETLFEEILPRLSTRVALWHECYKYLRVAALQSGSFLPTRAEVASAIDQAVNNGQYLVALLQGVDRNSMTEDAWLREDRFSDDERLLIASFVGRRELQIDYLQRSGMVTDGTIASLRDREILAYADQDSGRVKLEGTIWREYVERHIDYFQSLLDGADAARARVDIDSMSGSPKIPYEFDRYAQGVDD